jgi:hypothetical protein
VGAETRIDTINIPAALAGLSWSDQIVLDATNVLLSPGLKPAELGVRASSEIVAEPVAGASRVQLP